MRFGTSNMTMSQRMTLVAGCAAAAAGPVLAGPPNADHVSSHARVMVHVDLEALNSSTVGEWMLTLIEHESNNFEEIRQIFNGFTMRPEGGMTSVTAYAGGLNDDGPENLVVLIRGNENLKDWSLDLVRVLEGEGFDATGEVDGHPAIQVPMEDEIGFLTVMKDGGGYALLLGQDEESFTEGVEVFLGDRAAIDGAARTKISEVAGSGTIAMFGTSRLELFEEMDEASAVLDMAKSAWGRIGEKNGDMFAQMIVETTEPDKVDQLVKVYQGALAFGMIMQQDNEELQAVMDLAQSFKVNGKDGALRMSFERDAREMIEWFEEHNSGSMKLNIDVDDEDDADDGWGDDI